MRPSFGLEADGRIPVVARAQALGHNSSARGGADCRQWWPCWRLAVSPDASFISPITWTRQSFPSLSSNIVSIFTIVVPMRIDVSCRWPKNVARPLMTYLFVSSPLFIVRPRNENPLTVSVEPSFTGQDFNASASVQYNGRCAGDRSPNLGSVRHGAAGSAKRKGRNQVRVDRAPSNARSWRPVVTLQRATLQWATFAAPLRVPLPSRKSSSVALTVVQTGQTRQRMASPMSGVNAADAASVAVLEWFRKPEVNATHFANITRRRLLLNRDSDRI